MEGGLPSNISESEECKVFVEEGMKRVCFIGGLCLLLCHTRLKWMLGGRCHITDKIQQLIIVTVSQGTVWKQEEFGTDAPTRCTKQIGTELTAGILCWGVSFFLSPGRTFASFLCTTRQLILQRWGSSLRDFPGKRTLCIGQRNALPRSVQRPGLGGKVGAAFSQAKQKFSLLSCFPAALYESLRLAGKTGHQHHTSLLSSCHPCLAAEPAGKQRL